MKKQIVDASSILFTEADSFWKDFEFGNPEPIASYYNDFHTFTAAQWVVTETGTNTQAVSDAANGILLLTNAAADNDLTSIQLGNTGDASTGESFLPSVNRTIWMQARLALSDATETDALFGLVVTDTTPLTNANGIYFIKNDGDAFWNFVTTASSVSSTESNIIASTTGFITLGFKVVNLNYVEFWVNGAKLGQVETTIPTTELRPTFHIQNGEAVAKSMQIDYLFAAQTRVTS